ncbi:MAG: undecaprenyldiphospho-muramoylpentapeptide beta-N-acetylglucosaminyltransferase [Acaryochloris sp. RU_4_1]|nr:undecaprenyldiphospho-muramoylpentapeptide beta-N-acetylglucosaminyltransferase [Acaryochloris sp. SU_5_25]NJM64729.1 undecaprenyldiphospho-muramoylpentapeptide beta-N-acetylglucosaminyltransferase [Acaryochloris sp. RU_4_1]NJN37872.1 undecaprenyldiphospho-muramoylpentapeptide beta-N-acetylglucosaminyltransferase [Acaryochloridaceae cyanobacterium CSU_3_4]NJR53949.1 undecaprenyldiphospho-muramoylpentapeptide beta-N-acetylglucosaminyltransferase [Acaryochloris sp. CRU_2_0]
MVSNSQQDEVDRQPRRLLIAASGTGGHLFPALAVAEVLEADLFQLEWLGVSHRLETQLVPEKYPLHTVSIEGLQSRLGLQTPILLGKLAVAVWQTRQLLKQGHFCGVLTTGGYIAAPAILAAWSLGLPRVIHEANAIPGKVTRWLSSLCSWVALGFADATLYLPKARTIVVGTPVRPVFLNPCSLDLPIPTDAVLIVVAGGSQGAVALNRLVRTCAPAWLETGAWIVHLTGNQDSEAESFAHPHYLSMPFYENMAGLWQRADLAISRAGAGTLSELAIAATPALLIPYPYAAEDHQAFNAAVFAKAGAATVYRQDDLTAAQLEQTVLHWLQNPLILKEMAAKALGLAVPDSTERFAQLMREEMEATP